MAARSSPAWSFCSSLVSALVETLMEERQGVTLLGHGPVRAADVSACTDLLSFDVIRTMAEGQGASLIADEDVSTKDGVATHQHEVGAEDDAGARNAGAPGPPDLCLRLILVDGEYGRFLFACQMRMRRVPVTAMTRWGATRALPTAAPSLLRATGARTNASTLPVQ